MTRPRRLSGRSRRGRSPGLFPHEFFGIVTHPRIDKTPTPVELAIPHIEAWCASPQLMLLTESSQHGSVLREILRAGRIAGPKVHDARIAALCRQNGVRELWTADREFTGMLKLTTRNPLIQRPGKGG